MLSLNYVAGHTVVEPSLFDVVGQCMLDIAELSLPYVRQSMADVLR